MGINKSFRVECPGEVLTEAPADPLVLLSTGVVAGVAEPATTPARKAEEVVV